MIHVSISIKSMKIFILLIFMVIIGQLFSVLRRIWQIQALKLRRKGLKNIIIAYFILYLFFFHVSSFLRGLWPERVENPKLLQAILNPILIFAMSLVYSLIFLPGYLGVSAYKKYQIQENTKWAWQRENWAQMKRKTIINYIITYFIINPLFYTFLALIAKEESLNTKIQEFPQPLEIIKTFVLVSAFDDFLYMIVHRLFHQVPQLYKFHKVHHEYESVFTFANIYCHPIEHLFANIIPAVILFSFIKTHLATLIMWTLWKFFNSIEGHSGYQFPWFPAGAIPLIYGPGYHDFHHTKNVGNYATRLYLFELFFGTNESFFKYEFAKLFEAASIESAQKDQ